MEWSIFIIGWSFFESPSSLIRSNILTTDDEYKIQFAIPGLVKEDIKISVDESVITISHEKKETDDNTFYFTSSFKKEYSLPDDVDVDKIFSKLENGVLEINIPRTQKKRNERYIEIQWKWLPKISGVFFIYQIYL